MEKAVAYCRFSSDNQREESITAQYRAIKKYCDDNNIALIKMYKDEALSAKTDDRPQFKQMIRDSDKKLFDYVIVHKLDRFSRNRYDSAIYNKKLEENGVQLLSVLEKLDGSPESILMTSLIEGLNEYYSANLSREVIKGMKENAYQAKFNGGTVPLGYNIVDSKYVINKHESEAVKMVFEEYADGYSMGKIADKLNRLGFRTKKGNKFNSKSFNTLIKNEIYIGTYTYKIDGKVIKKENAIPKIIDKDLFIIAQNATKSRRKYKLTDNYDYMLLNLIYCDDKKMSVKAGTGKSGKVYHYYGLDDRYINAEKTDYYMSRFLIDVLLSDENIEKLTYGIHEEFAEISLNSDDVKDLRKELSKINIQIENGTKAILNGTISKTLDDKLKDLEEQKMALENRIAEKEIIRELSTDEFDRLMKKYYKKALENDRKALKILMHQLIDRIDLQEDDALTVSLRAKGSLLDFVVGHRGLEPRTYRL